MKTRKGLITVMVTVSFCLVLLSARGILGGILELPEPSFEGELSVEKAIKRSRSVRNYREEPLDLKDVSQLM